MADILQITFSNAFSAMKIAVFWLKSHWNMFQKAQLRMVLHRFKQWLGTWQATSHYLNQWWPSLVTHICISWPQWFKSLAPGGCDSNFKSIIFIIQSSSLSGEWHRSSLMRNQHWFRKWLGAVRQQAIAWAIVDRDLCHHMASLGHNVLKKIWLH